MLAGLRGLLGFGDARGEESAGRTHVLAHDRPARLYAIGDVHGCLTELLALERLILADAADTEGEKWIVTLGDYVDRGPASAQVVDHLMAPPPAGFKRICLTGNHEQMLLDFLQAPRHNQAWLDYGGLETARSYGLSDAVLASNPLAIARALAGRIPSSHIAWLAELPIVLAVPGFTFVHAGLRPRVALERQSDEDLLWIREPFLDDLTPGASIIVHGHTPQVEPISTPCRIGIDTAAFATGRLTALRLDQDGGMSFLSTH
jgi:serine/threonine protein phosphatase 1